MKNDRKGCEIIKNILEDNKMDEEKYCAINNISLLDFTSNALNTNKFSEISENLLEDLLYTFPALSKYVCREMTVLYKDNRIMHRDIQFKGIDYDPQLIKDVSLLIYNALDQRIENINKTTSKSEINNTTDMLNGILIHSKKIVKY